MVIYDLRQKTRDACNSNIFQLKRFMQINLPLDFELKFKAGFVAYS